MTARKLLSTALVAAVLGIPTTDVAAAAGSGDTSTGARAAASEGTFPEGVYRFTRTRADILRAWPNADKRSLRAHAGTLTFTFRRGTFTVVLAGGGLPGCRRFEGRYSVKGRFVTTSWTSGHGCELLDQVPTPPLKLRWSYDGKALRFRLVRTGTPTDHVVWESNPFVRIR